MGIPDHLTCLLRNLYAGQEATVRTGHGTTDWFQIGKGVRQGCILSSCLFTLCAEYIMRNAGLEEAQAGIKLPTSAGSWKKHESSRKRSISVLLTMPKPLTVWITINCGKLQKSWEYQITWPASWKTYMQVRKQQLELDMEQQTGSK